jgi:hypothetical protein
MDENLYGADAIMSDEELELELELEDTEDIEALKSALAKEKAIKKQLLARAKKAEAGNKKPQIIKTQEKGFTIDDETLDLRLDGYTRDEVEFIARNGGRKELENPNSLVAVALNTKREQKRAEEMASKTEDTSGLSEFEKKYTPEMMANMSAKELRDILPKA